MVGGSDEKAGFVSLNPTSRYFGLSFIDPSLWKVKIEESRKDTG
jgi:hypothetical protein